MKKSVLFLICLFIFPLFHFAQADVTGDDSNWGIQPTKSVPAPTEKSEQTWQDEHDEAIYDNYGSDQSPAFLNREKINPNESNYNYGTPDGNE